MQMQGSYIYIIERTHIVYNPYKILSLPVMVTVIVLRGIAVVVVMPRGVAVAVVALRGVVVVVVTPCVVSWSWPLRRGGCGGCRRAAWCCGDCRCTA